MQRGAVPEQPIGEMKNDWRCERLSSRGFSANALRLLIHTLAYALVVLFREAAAVVVTSGRRIWLHVATSWPYRAVWRRVQEAVAAFVTRLRSRAAPPEILVVI